MRSREFGVIRKIIGMCVVSAVCVLRAGFVNAHTMGDRVGGTSNGMHYNSGGREDVITIASLPRPVLDEHPGWIKLYERTWELAANNIHKGTEENGFVEKYMDENFGDGINQWDLCFVMMFGKYGNGQFPGILTMENFYMRQHENGFITRTIQESTGRDKQSEKSGASINPPLYSWAEWENYLISGDAGRFTKKIVSQSRPNKGDEIGPNITKTIFERLCDYYHWIKKTRRNGLLYWQSNMGSGLDNSPAYAYPQASRQYWTICLSSQQAQNAWYLAKIAGVVGDTEKKEFFAKEHRDLANEINRNLWNADDRIYYNKDSETVWRKVKYICAFWPMIGHVPDQEQVDGLVEHLENPKEFMRPVPVPTLSADDPDYANGSGYWRGAVWAPTNYQLIKGLEAYGRYALAKLISEKYIEALYQEYLVSNTVWENYNAERPYGCCKKDFTGWTGVGPIALLIESVIGIHLDAQENKVLWVLSCRERNGIENLHFNKGVINTMICAARDSAEAPAEITIDTKKEFVLTCIIGGKEYKKEIKKGSNTYKFGEKAE